MKKIIYLAEIHDGNFCSVVPLRLMAKTNPNEDFGQLTMVDFKFKPRKMDKFEYVYMAIPSMRFIEDTRCDSMKKSTRNLVKKYKNNCGFRILDQFGKVANGGGNSTIHI